MKTFGAVAFAFTSPTLRVRTVAYAIGLFVLLGIPTALLSNPIIPYIRMVPATPLDYVFLAATSVLAAVYLALPAGKCKADKTAAGGGVLGFLSFACPTCIHLLVLLVGFEFAYNVINPLRPAIGLFSIIVLAYAIEKKFSSAQHEK